MNIAPERATISMVRERLVERIRGVFGESSPLQCFQFSYSFSQPFNIEELIKMIAYFERVEIQMTLKEAQSASHSGSCDLDVEKLLNSPKIQKQLAKIPASKIKEELREYGAWDEEELKDESQNQMRIVWIAAGNIQEEYYNKHSKEIVNV